MFLNIKFTIMKFLGKANSFKNYVNQKKTIFKIKKEHYNLFAFKFLKFGIYLKKERQKILEAIHKFDLPKKVSGT